LGNKHKNIFNANYISAYFCISMTNVSGSFSVIIPAAGYSSRMGMPKLLLPFKDHTFCEEIVERYHKAGAEKIVIVINQQLVAKCETLFQHWSKPLQIVVNDNPALGRFRSVRIGLSVVTPDIPCFLQNADNPFVNQQLIFDLLCVSKPDHTVIPYFEKNPGHPVLIGENIIENLKHCSDDDANLRTELGKYNIKTIDTSSPEILLNINTPEDYMRVFGKPLPEK